MSSPDEHGAGEARYRNEGIRSLLAHFTAGPPDELLSIHAILGELRHSGFGVFLFVAILPAFVPIPGVGGAVSGPLAMLIGLQLLIGLRNPWVPALIGRQGPRRSTTQRFMGKIGPLLRWLDRALRPRLQLLVAPLPARIFTGLLVALTGLLLSLPIPLTNYLFGVILLAFALALLERDGVLMLACWIAAIACLCIFGLTSDQLIDVAGDWLAKLR